jgi:hypothetical protein
VRNEVGNNAILAAGHQFISFVRKLKILDLIQGCLEKLKARVSSLLACGIRLGNIIIH